VTLQALARACLALALLAPGAAAQKAGISIARVSYVEGVTELRPEGKGWAAAQEGASFHIGDQIRTGPQGQARIDFPWMSVGLSGASRLAIPPSLVLATVLEDGRVELRAPGGEIVKLLTAEARIRGAGRVTVRRIQDRTVVSVLEGSFRVEAAGKIVTLEGGEGTLIGAGKAPLPPVKLPPPPTGLDPADDPLYAAPEQPVQLAFESSARAHHLQILGFDAPDVLLERDFAGSPASIAVPWPGTYRWRVSARSPEGLESIPSREGLITIYPR
jgi:hypothetical protein